MKETLKVYLDHGEAYGNLGDEAMLITAVDRLTHCLGNCRFVIPRENGKPLPDLPPNVEFIDTPRWVFRVAGRLTRIIFQLAAHIPYVSRYMPQDKDRFSTLIWRNVDWILGVILPGIRWLPTKFSKSVRVIRTCDIFYSVGAADFNDYNLRDLVYKAWLYNIVKSWIKVRVVSSQGVGPVDSEWSKRKIKRAFESIQILSFRDCRYSKSIVEELALQNVKYCVVGDEAFGLSIAKEENISDFLAEACLQNGQSFIAFHFRATDYTKDIAFLVPKVAALLDNLCSIVPHYFVFFPMSYHVHSGFDKICGEAIKEHMSHPERLLLTPLCKDVRIVKGAIGRSVYSLGLSYHVHVFALSQNKPAIIVYSGDYYRYKSEGLIGFYGEPCRAIDMEQSSIEEIAQAVQDVETNYESAIKNIISVNEHIGYINDWHLREMKSTLTKYG